MGYYHIKSCPFPKKLYTIVLPLKIYEHQKLPMGLCTSPNIFQEKKNKLFNGLEYVRIYIYDLLIISNTSFENNINKLDKVQNKIKQKGSNINAEKSFFARNELEKI